MPKRKTITGPAGVAYDVGECIAASERYRVYECNVPDCSAPTILRIALTAAENEYLDREGFVLTLMAARAEELEAAHIVPEGTEYPERKKYNYQNFFPALIESFVSASQDGRRINVLAFPAAIKSLYNFTPIWGLTEVEQVYVDPRTGAWMLGKALKILAFAHDQGIAVGLRDTTHILVERNLHGVFVADWTRATLHGDVVPRNVARSELMLAGRAALAIMGGDVATGMLPASDQLESDAYENFLRELVVGERWHAGEAHKEFYALIKQLWPGKTWGWFHPYTAYERKGR